MASLVFVSAFSSSDSVNWLSKYAGERRSQTAPSLETDHSGNNWQSKWSPRFLFSMGPLAEAFEAVNWLTEKGICCLRRGPLSMRCGYNILKSRGNARLFPTDEREEKSQSSTLMSTEKGSLKLIFFSIIFVILFIRKFGFWKKKHYFWMNLIFHLDQSTITIIFNSGNFNFKN